MFKIVQMVQLLVFQTIVPLQTTFAKDLKSQCKLSILMNIIIQMDKMLKLFHRLPIFVFPFSCFSCLKIPFFQVSTEGFLKIGGSEKNLIV